MNGDIKRQTKSENEILHDLVHPREPELRRLLKRRTHSPKFYPTFRYLDKSVEDT